MAAASTLRPQRTGRLLRAGWLLVPAGLLVLLVAVPWIHGTDGQPAPASGGAGLWAHPANAAAGRQTAAAPLATGLEGLPRSLQGTEVDGGAAADGAGHLRVDAALRRLFDYFLSTVGEEPMERVRQRLLAWLRTQLPPTAAREATGLLDRYIAYQAARGEMGRGQPLAELSLPALQQRFDALVQLRQQHFSPAEAAAFFGDEEAQDRYTLQRLAVLQDTGLSPADKAQRLRQLAASLPPALQAELTVEDKLRDLDAVTQEWRAKGGTPQALREARVQLVGVDAADRLEALDQRRAQWTQRLQAYRVERAALATDASLSSAQRDQALARLRSTSFTPQELLRVDAAEAAAR